MPGFGGFGGMDVFASHGFNDAFSNAHSFTSSSMSVSGGFAPQAGIKKTTTSTRFVNGKKIETRKVTENNMETVTIVENGVLISKTVDGVAQPLTYG